MYFEISNPLEYHAALYIRLSKEDESEGPSQSVQNQESLLREFVQQHRLNVYDAYVDDGWSGTNFDRPGFRRMTADIEAKKVNMVITKDLSRLGRDYIMTGHYMERYFPEHRVRYISLLDGIDTGVDSTANDITPFRAIMNALIAHERAMNLASNVVVDMQMEGVQISLEPSPTDLRGLTHRELGDHTDTLALLMEAPNPAQGRLRDRTDEALVLTGKSETYVKAGEIGQLYVPYDENGWPIEVRCARHVFGIERILANYSEMYEEPIIVTGMPSYDELVKNGMGPYLNEPTT